MRWDRNKEEKGKKNQKMSFGTLPTKALLEKSCRQGIQPAEFEYNSVGKNECLQFQV